MDLKNWVEDLVKGIEAPAPVAKDSVMLNELSLIDAIEGHISWKRNWFQSLKDKKPEAQNVALVSSDCNCYVGKWIYSAGTIYQNMNEYKHLVSIHADFHQCAGRAVGLYTNGKVFDAVALTKGELNNLSKDVSMAILDLCTGQAAQDTFI